MSFVNLKFHNIKRDNASFKQHLIISASFIPKKRKNTNLSFHPPAATALEHVPMSSITY